MKTLVINATAETPQALLEIVRHGSTEITETPLAEIPRLVDADRVVVWDGHDVLVQDRRLRWPEDEDELRLYFETAA